MVRGRTNLPYYGEPATGYARARVASSVASRTLSCALLDCHLTGRGCLVVGEIGRDHGHRVGARLLRRGPVDRLGPAPQHAWIDGGHDLLAALDREVDARDLRELEAQPA